MIPSAIYPQERKIDTGDQKICSVEDCGKRHRARGLCNRHYRIALASTASRIPKSKTRHGHAANRERSLTYISWISMMMRCYSKNHPSYLRYGAVGIRVYGPWHDFTTFLRDVGERPDQNHSIDRWPDRKGHYGPNNVRWAKWLDQCRNRDACRAVIRSDGLWFPSMAEAAEATGGDRNCIRCVCIGRQKTHRGFTWKFAEDTKL